MNERWYVCAGPERAEALRRFVRDERPDSVIQVMTDPWQARRCILAEAPGSSNALVGDGCGDMPPINLASALVADGHADKVVLVVGDACGSLRSRAMRAGISQVLEEGETSDAVRVADEKQHAVRAAQGNAATRAARRGESGDAGEDVGADLDEVDGIVAPPKKPAKRVPSHASPILCFASGRGGVGKTSISTVASALGESWGMKVALVDLDLAFGNAYSYLGLDGPADLSPIAEPSSNVRDVCQRSGRKVTNLLSVWGPCVRPELAETVVPHVGELLSMLSDTHDLVIVDTSSDWGDEAAATAQMCDRLILVSDERAGAIGSLSRAAALAVRLGVARTRIMRVMNRCDRRHRDEGFLARADVGLETARSFRVLDGDVEVAELLSAGHALDLAKLDSDFTDSVASLLAQVLAELGNLPTSSEAQKAASKGSKRHSRSFPWAKREAS